MLARKILLAARGQEDPADLFSLPAWLLLIKARAARSGLIRAYTDLRIEPGATLMAISEIAIQSLAVLAVLTAAYLFLIRPQLKRITEHDLLFSSLNLGDRVVTGGGLIGKIVKLEGTNIVELELSKSVRVQAIRSSIESKFRE